MRILRVRFKNLNSLAGEWSIDFSHPAYAAEGIAAITGPTGAGKSTILDAICLALYGRTPRLNNINQTANEILSRKTGECFAEVLFETQAGRFNCHWSQRRARGSAEGKLQAQKHELANARTGEMLASKVKEVEACVIEITGMSFERFIRTMFLAQGNFAAFLLASPDERAPILEQITGTGIYSDISRRAHERYALEHKRLEELQARLSGMSLLSPDEELLLRNALQQEIAAEKALADQLAGKREEISWLEKIASLEEDLRLIIVRKQELAERKERFEPLRRKLGRAAQALELSGAASELGALRKEHAAEQEKHAACMRQLSESESLLVRGEAGHKGASEALAEARSKQLEAAPGIRKARELDVKIREKLAPLSAATNSLAEKEKEHALLEQKQTGDLALLREVKEKSAALAGLMRARQADRALVESFVGIKLKVIRATSLWEQLAAKGHEKKAVDKQLADCAGEWKQCSLALERAAGEKKQAEEKLAQREKELKTLLQGETIDVWRERQLACARQSLILERAVQAWEAGDKARGKAGAAKAELERLRRETGALELVLPERDKQVALLEQNRAALENQMLLLQKVKAYEEERAFLEEGKPCPLCGATVHPYALGNKPQPDEQAGKLALVREELKTLRESQSADNMRLGRLRGQAAQVEKSLAETALLIKEAEDALQAHCLALSLEPGSEELPARLEALRKDREQEQEKLSLLLRNAAELEAGIAALRDSHGKSIEAAARAERESALLEQKKSGLLLAAERLGTEADTLQSEYQAAHKEVLEEIGPFGMEAGQAESLEEVLAVLSQRREQWLAWEKELAGYERSMAALEPVTGQQADLLQKSRKELQERREHVSALERELATLREERKALLGDMSPETEEERLAKAVESAQVTLDAASEAVQKARQSVGSLREMERSLSASLNARNARLNSTEAAFAALCREKGFADEADFRSACLTGEERAALIKQGQALTDEETALSAGEEEKSRLLNVEKEKELSAMPLDVLRKELADLLEKQKDKQQEIGGINRKLIDNEQIREKQREQAALVDAQRRECLRWDMLHDLIGSADGKKFRNFAQGLTFEMLIAYANRQLAKLSDRYLLLHSPDRPLELSVVDNYQAGEIRSAKNLSGGESFIVSLALALGLSYMAGKSVRVDSLFLDEGFGSLDEEALGIALDTLGSLKQEGKLIVVISHVQALKDCIAAQIKVSPLAGGRSRISGPGCEAGAQGLS